MQQKIRVGLLFGGRSGEHEVSIASALSVYSALDKSRYEICLIAIDKAGRWLLPDPKALLAQATDPMYARVPETPQGLSVVPYASTQQMIPIGPTQGAIPHLDVMLPILHGTNGEDGTIQGLLELVQIPYVGSGVLGSALGMDKEISRKLLKAEGIATVPTLSLRRPEYEKNSAEIDQRIVSEFGFPVFIKPANAGSSVGVHKVKSREALPAAIHDALTFDVKVLVEKAIDARELECSVLGNDAPKVSVIGEAIPHHEFYDYSAKYLDADGVSFQIPALDVSPLVAQKIVAWAKLAFLTLECRGMARVDFFLDRQSGELYLNEINTIPGFTHASMYPKMWEASGLLYSDLLDELIRLAFEVFEQRKKLKMTYDR